MHANPPTIPISRLVALSLAPAEPVAASPVIQSVNALALHGARFVEIVYERGELRGNVSVLMTDRHAGAADALNLQADAEMERAMCHISMARLFRAAAAKAVRDTFGRAGQNGDGPRAA